MRALPVQSQPLWRTDFRQRIAVSLWFLPTIFAVAAIVAANLTIWLDSQVDAPIGVRPDLVSDPGSAATFAGAIAAATLAFVAVVFATTLVAIQLAASQYSPRTVRIFIRSRVTRVTLGLFLATFVFSVIVLVSNRASVTLGPAVRAGSVGDDLAGADRGHGLRVRRLPAWRGAAHARPVPAGNDRHREPGHRGELPAGVGLR